MRLGFYFIHINLVFLLFLNKRLISASLITLFDYGDVLYMNACSTSLHMLDATYHRVLRFITGCKSLTHHCTMYSKVDWLFVGFIYKAITGLLPSYLCTYLTFKLNPSYSLRSLDFVSTSVPRTRTEFRKRAFMYSTPSAWNSLQKTQQLQELITINASKTWLTSY